MASSFVSFDNIIGFWVSDSLLEITCSYIVKIIDEKSDEKPEWLLNMQNLLKENSEGLYPSYMHLGLSDYLNTEERKKYFLEILQLVRRALQKKGDRIEPEELNSFVVNEELQGLWSQPLETSLILKLINFLELLIAGDLKIKVDDPVDYW
jgi:hypothetical protein